jgi:hypothetical protein
MGSFNTSFVFTHAREAKELHMVGIHLFQKKVVRAIGHRTQVIPRPKLQIH